MIPNGSVLIYRSTEPARWANILCRKVLLLPSLMKGKKDFFFLIKKTKRRGEGHLWTAPGFRCQRRTVKCSLGRNTHNKKESFSIQMYLVKWGWEKLQLSNSPTVIQWVIFFLIEKKQTGEKKKDRWHLVFIHLRAGGKEELKTRPKRC